MSDQEELATYTPTTNQVRDVFLLGAIDAAGGEDNLDTPVALAMFDRWLTSRTTEARAEGAAEALGRAAVEVEAAAEGEQWLAPGDNPYRAEATL